MLHPTKRQSEILRYVGLHGSYPIGDLASELGVSDETIRRDVRSLADEGLVMKVHGAIVAPDHLREGPFQHRLLENREEKLRIAAYAAGLVGHGESIMLDTGSTTAYVAQNLTTHRNLLAVTNSLEAARSLASKNGNRVYMAGGEIRADDGATFGAAANSFASRFQVDTAFLSITAINERDALMVAELWEAEFSRVVIGQAARVIVVADHSKFGRRALIKVCDFAAIHMLITSAPPPPAVADSLRAAGTEVVVV